jgi:hypothetical protein
MHLAATRIVGSGESRVGKVPEKRMSQRQSDAVYAALDDAGLTLKDIDVASWSVKNHLKSYSYTMTLPTPLRSPNALTEPYCQAAHQYRM